MGFYETTYILHSALQEGRLNDIINVIEKKTKSIGAEILYTDNWGRKKLSYLIQKEKYGTYIFFQYKVKDTTNLKELTSEFQHNPNILRHLTIEIEEQDVMENNQNEKVDSKEDKKEEAIKVEKSDINESNAEEKIEKEEESDVNESNVEEKIEKEEESDKEELKNNDSDKEE